MDEEISLRELIETLLAGKWVIVVFTIIAILIGGVFSYWVIEPTYEAKTILAVNQTNVRNNPSEGLEGLVNTISEIPQVSVQSYVTQAKSAAVLNKVMDRLNIDDKTISLGAFANTINITNIKDTELLEITVKDKSPQKAAEIANVLAEEMVEFITDTNKLRTQKSLVFLGKLVEEEQKNLDSGVEQMKQFLIQPDSVAELQAKLDTNIMLLSQFQENKAQLLVDINKVAAAVRALEKQLQEVPEKVELKKSIYDDPALYLLLAEGTEGKDNSFSILELRSEEINPVYTELKNELELNKAMLVQFEAEQASLNSEITSISNTINNLQVKLADKKTRLDQLQMEIDTAKDNYTMFNNKYTESQIAESMKIGEAALMVVSAADYPTSPVAPRKTLILAIAACLGLMLGVFVVLFKGYWVSSAADRKQQQAV